MIRMLNIGLAVTSLIMLVGVYALKYQTVETANEKLDLERTIDRQRNELSLLKAEWAYLNQPAHIEPIVRRHAERLKLQVAEQNQFVHIEDIPMRPYEADSEGLTELLKSLEDGVDPIGELIEANAQ